MRRIESEESNGLDLADPLSLLLTDPDSLHSIRISNSMGGRMVKVWPLALLGVSPRKIAEITQLSLKQVYQCEHRLREKGRIEKSHIEYNKSLARSLESCPEGALGQALIDSVNFSFYRRNQHLFATGSEVLTAAGLHYGGKLKDWIRFDEKLTSSEIPMKIFIIVTKERGKVYEARYRIIPRRFFDRAVKLQVEDTLQT